MNSTYKAPFFVVSTIGQRSEPFPDLLSARVQANLRTNRQDDGGPINRFYVEDATGKEIFP